MMTGLVEALWRIQEGCCFHCGEIMLSSTPSDHSPLEWSREHLKARNRNRKRRSSQFVLAHRECNNRRGNINLDAEDVARAEAIIAQLPAAMVDVTEGRGGVRSKGPRYGKFLRSGEVATLGDFWPRAQPAAPDLFGKG